MTWQYTPRCACCKQTNYSIVNYLYALDRLSKIIGWHPASIVLFHKLSVAYSIPGNIAQHIYIL